MAIHGLNEEMAVQKQATTSARESARVTYNQFNSGMIDYLNVATTEATSLSQQQNELNIIKSQLINSVKLIVALGGGWNVSDLPSATPPKKNTAK